MPFDVTFEASRGVVLLQLKGRLDMEEAEEAAVAATAKGLEQSCSRFLVDARQVTSHLSFDELASLGRSLDCLRVVPGDKVALLSSQFEVKSAFFEAVAAEAGHPLRRFHSEALALRWLGQGEATGSGGQELGY
jgi:hypothetical protein